MSRPLSVVFALSALALSACDPFDEGSADTDVAATGDGTDVFTNPDRDPLVTGCDVGYQRPLPDGKIAVTGVALHDDVFGTSAPAPRHVHLGWPGSDTSNSISIIWLTDTDTLATQVEMGVGEITDPASLDLKAEGVSFLFGGLENESFRAHEFRNCGGLQPDTVYSYRVGGEGHWSPIYTFKTPPPPGTFDTFTVAFSGDSRGAYEVWGTLLAQMESYNPDFYLFNGDMVEAGPNQNEWEAWFAASGDILASKVLVSAHGNHEILATNYFAQFGFPGNEQWFDVRYGSMHVVSLNDTVINQNVRENDQPAFIRSTLGSSEADWKVAVHHQPTYSTCTRHNSNLELRRQWEAAIKEVGTDVVLAGHNHIYERSKSLAVNDQGQTDVVPMGDGTLYLVSGGAGAPLYRESENQWFGDVANPTEHFIIGEFGPDKATFTARDLNGNVIDSWEIPNR